MLRSDYSVISPYHIHKLSSKQVIKTLKLIKYKLLSWSNANFLLLSYKEMCSS